MITAIETGTVVVVVIVIEAAVRHRILSNLVVSSSDYDNDNDNDGGCNPPNALAKGFGIRTEKKFTTEVPHRKRCAVTQQTA